jgi:hypothetical protein
VQKDRIESWRRLHGCGIEFERSILQGPRVFIRSTATCAAPPCEVLTPCRGRRPHHVQKDRIGSWEFDLVLNLKTDIQWLPPSQSGWTNTSGAHLSSLAALVFNRAPMGERVLQSHRSISDQGSPSFVSTYLTVSFIASSYRNPAAGMPRRGSVAPRLRFHT